MLFHKNSPRFIFMKVYKMVSDVITGPRTCHVFFDFCRQNINLIAEHVKSLLSFRVSGARDEDEDPCQNNSGEREVTQPCVTSVGGGEHHKNSSH